MHVICSMHRYDESFNASMPPSLALPFRDDPYANLYNTISSPFDLELQILVKLMRIPPAALTPPAIHRALLQPRIVIIILPFIIRIRSIRYSAHRSVDENLTTLMVSRCPLSLFHRHPSHPSASGQVKDSKHVLG